MLPEELFDLARHSEEDLITEVLSLFMSDSASRLLALKSAVLRGDTDAIRSGAHALKGSAGQVGAAGMAEACRLMEESCVSANTGHWTVLLERLQARFQEACEAMSGFQERPRG